jgi:hypothetical protein
MVTPDKRPRPDDEIEDEHSPNPSDKQKSKTTDGVETMDLEESRAVQNLNKRFAANPSPRETHSRLLMLLLRPSGNQLFPLPTSVGAFMAQALALGKALRRMIYLVKAMIAFIP